jgi:hypothetical protein
MSEYNFEESQKQYDAAIKDGSLEKSKWSVTLNNGKVIEYYQINGEGKINDASLVWYLNPNANDLGDGAPEEDAYIQFSYLGRYPKDINDPVSVMLAIGQVYNEYAPFKYSGNYPDTSAYTRLPDGAVE